MKSLAYSPRYRIYLLLGIAIVPMFSVGCGTTNTDRGLTGGGALGAAVGALAGGPRHRLGGALAGGVIGAAAGGLAGNAMDHSERKQAIAREAAARPPLQLEEIVSLTANNISDQLIIDQIRNSNSVYRLQANDLLYLKQNGVHEPVISYMQATASRPVPVYQPVQVVQPVYVAEPPPVGVGIGVRIR